jgi:hypothetical protein
MDAPPEMVAALESNRNQILSINGVQGVDIGFTEPDGTPTEDLAIRVLVPDLSNPPAGIPETVDGFQVTIIQRDIQLTQDLTRHDPVQGGISVGRGTGFASAGTLGAVVLDAASRELRGLSNKHVLCDPLLGQPFAVGDDIQQPAPNTGASPANHLGTLAAFSQPTPILPPLPPSLPLGFDAAICTIDRTATATIADIGPVNGTAIAHPNDVVSKRGSSSLLTHGIVNGYRGAMEILGRPDFFRQETFEIRVDSSNSTGFSKGGDSGSVVVLDTTGEIVGLLWGGTTDGAFGYASDIESIAVDLGISLFWPIPQISSITPTQGTGQGGVDVTITGTGFQLASSVTFGGAPATFSRQPTSDTDIIATTPPGSGTVDVLVTAPGGTSLASSFTYT